MGRFPYETYGKRPTGRFPFVRSRALALGPGAGPYWRAHMFEEGEHTVSESSTRSGTAVAEDPAGLPMVRVEDLRRSYGTGEAAVHALRGVSFDIPRGELVALKGRSGSGKTTLLNLVGGLDSADGGRIVIDGTDLSTLGENGLLELRRDRIGFIFQSFGLLPILSAAENVGVPLRLRKADPKEREERVALMLSLVGLADHAAQRPGELSGGQQQRVAIARALANKLLPC